MSDALTYAAFFKGRKAEIKATSLYEAKMKAIALFKPTKRDMGLLAVVLAAKNGENVTQFPD